MLKVGGWLGGGKNHKPGQTRSLNALDELAQSMGIPYISATHDLSKLTCPNSRRCHVRCVHEFPARAYIQTRHSLTRATAVTHIMNDDVDAAEAHLSKGSSPFHQVRCAAPDRCGGI